MYQFGNGYEDMVLVLEKETKFKTGKRGSRNLRHLRKKRRSNSSKKYISAWEQLCGNKPLPIVSGKII